MKVKQIGEFGLIDRLQNEFTATAPGLVLGIGDDAAIWRGEGLAVATTDTMVEDVHFRVRTTSWRELGWKSLASNLSDVAAMGGQPRYALVTFGLRDDAEVEDVLELARGLAEVGKRFGSAVIGGDLVGSPLATFITVALYGVVPDDGHGPPLLRAAARPGDQVAVTGWLGRSAAGLRMLSENPQAAPEVVTELRRAHNQPCPRVPEGYALRGAGVRAAIDVSDGLAGDVGHIAEMSGVGIRLRADALPVHPFVQGLFPEAAFDLTLFGGEEYELIFAAPPAIMARARAALDDLGTRSTVIGEVVPEPRGKVMLAWPDGREALVGRGAWDHFRA
ncbi:MAG: thiamine-phosphate kinase [Chloroflexota bacterium]